MDPILEEDLVERVMAITSGVAGPLLEKLAEAAAAGAVIFEYGALSPEPTAFPLWAAMKKGLIVRGYTLFEIVQDGEKLAGGKRYVHDGLKSGALKPVIDCAFPLDAIADAHRYMESNRQQGKIVVAVS